MSDVLRKPVHPVLLLPTHVESLSGRFGEQPRALPSPKKQPLPKPAGGQQRPKMDRPQFVGPREMLKQETTKRHLRILYDSLPEKLYAEKDTPPCSTCKTSPCCSYFMVNLTKEEYESGVFDPYAVKMDAVAARQLESFIPWKMVHQGDNPVYFIEGLPGSPCPFLGSNNECTIYDWRPITCREYTCKTDIRITQEMRDGL